MWLIGQVWWAMALAAGSGAAFVVLFSTRRLVVERWVDAPVEEAAASQAGNRTDAATDLVDGTAAGAASSVDELESPFPVVGGARPWEEEELWSRPARARVAPAGRSAGKGDEWSKAAESWRDWAGVATGKVAVPAEERAARSWASDPAEAALAVPSADAFVPSTEESPFPFGGVEHEPVDPFPYAEPVDAFPYARPVEAGADRDDGDDDREAEEIRLALELRRREREEAERLERERAEAERLEQERAEAERLERERVARLEVQRAEAERLQRERAEAERLERERVARLEQARVEAERAAQEARQEAGDGPGADATDTDDDDTWRKGPYGPGSSYAPYDGSAPPGYSVKGHIATKTFHTRRSRLYARAQADVWFDTEQAAEAAGFVRWDRRGTSLGTAVLPGDE